jgi:hypothetical protein
MTSRACLIIFGAALSGETSCSRRSLDRPLAAALILRHEQGRYSEECDVTFLAKAQENNWGASVSDLRAKIGAQLGRSLCVFSVEVTGIALTSDSTRDVVFSETKSYDEAKVSALSAYVDALFARISALSVQAVPSDYPALFGYYLAVADPSDGQEYLLDYTSRSAESAKEHAKIKQLTIGDVWDNMPSGLARHKQAHSVPTVRTHRTGTLQLFDDGWRVLAISPAPPAINSGNLPPVWGRARHEEDIKAEAGLKHLENLLRR